jgi:hypothetical protein
MPRYFYSNFGGLCGGQRGAGGCCISVDRRSSATESVPLLCVTVAGAQQMYLVVYGFCLISKVK